MTRLPYNRIVSYGCSFTAGSELTDHAVLGMSDSEFLEYVRSRKITYAAQLYEEMKLPEGIKEQIAQSNAAASWPNMIAAHFNIPHENRAIGGSSLSNAVHKVLQDYHNGNIQSEDLVLIGATSPARWFQFLEDGHEMGGVLGMSWSGRVPVNYQTALEENWFNAYNILYDYFKDLLLLSLLSDQHGGQIKLAYAFGTPDYFRFFFAEELKHTKFAKFFDFCCSLVPAHNLLDQQFSISGLAGPRCDERHHVFGHPRIQFHHQFSQILIKKLEEIYND